MSDEPVTLASMIADGTITFGTPRWVLVLLALITIGSIVAIVAYTYR